MIRSRLKYLVKLLVAIGMILITIQPALAEVSSSERSAKLKLAKAAYGCGFMVARITKDYLYAGNNVGVRQAKREIKKALKAFEEKIELVNKSINDEKNKNLLTFIEMSFEELRELIKEPYSLDNAQIALDLSATILEGSRFIAEDIKKSINFTDRNIIIGSRIYFESIASYYMAYQAGIKDDNTIRLMKDVVDNVTNNINNFSKDPRNTVDMNQRMNKVQRLWKVVDKFYLDIDKGGLPFIVYKTTKDLNKHIAIYSEDIIKAINNKGLD